VCKKKLGISLQSETAVITQILAVTQVLMEVEFGVTTSVLGETYKTMMLRNAVQCIHNLKLHGFLAAMYQLDFLSHMTV